MMHPRAVTRALALVATAFLLAVIFLPTRARAQTSSGATGPSATTPATQLDWQAVGDTARFYLRWQRPCNASGCADSVRIAWTLNGVAQPVRTRAHILGAMWVADTVKPLRAWCPAPTTASVVLTFLRRGTPVAPVTRSASMGCRDQILLPPDSTLVVLDTGATRFASALHVDSLRARLATDTSMWYQITRGDSMHAMVHVQRERAKPYRILGATITAPTTCDGMWWHTGDTTSLRVAQARATQWPMAVLTSRATAAFKAVDYSGCAYCQVWQSRCA